MAKNYCHTFPDSLNTHRLCHQKTAPYTASASKNAPHTGKCPLPLRESGQELHEICGLALLKEFASHPVLTVEEEAHASLLLTPLPSFRHRILPLSYKTLFPQKTVSALLQRIRNLPLSNRVEKWHGGKLSRDRFK